MSGNYLGHKLSKNVGIEWFWQSVIIVREPTSELLQWLCYDDSAIIIGIIIIINRSSSIICGL